MAGFDTGQILYIVLDVLFVAIASYFVIQLLNTAKGWRYLLILLGAFVVLVLGSLIALPGLHMLAQGVLIMLIVALPILFQEEWQQLIGRAAGQPYTPTAKTLGTPVVILLSVLFSLLLVGIGTGINTRTDTFPTGIKLTATNVPNGLSASFGNVQTIQVVVNAPRSTWKSLTADSFSAVVDLGNQKEGSYDLTVQVTSKVSGVTIVRTKPADVVVTVEPIIRKTVPIVVKFSGKAGNDLVPDDPSITPQNVEITGPKSVVSDITEAVAPIHLNGETQDINQKVTLTAQTPSGDDITTVSINPTEATIGVPLVKSGKLKTVGIQAAVTGQPQAGYWVKTVTVNPGVVTVTGSADALNNLTQVTTQPISVNGLTDTKQQQVTLVLPSGITIADNTVNVTVSVVIDRTSTTKTVTPQLTYANLSDSLKVTSTSPQSISAIVSGTSDLLASLKDGDVKASLDLSAYKSAGTYAITIANGSFTLPDGVSLVSFLPSAINVTLENK